MKRLLPAFLLALALTARGAPPPYHSEDPGTEENFQTIFNQMATHVHDGNGTAPLPSTQLGLAYGDTPYAMIVDAKATGTGGGTNVAGAIATRTLNTISTSTISDLTLVSSSITIPAGTYRVQWSSPFYRTGRAKTYLRATAGDFVEVNGTCAWSEGTTANATSLSQGIGIFTVNQTTTIVLSYASDAVFATTGLGMMANLLTLSEIYTVVELWKLR